MGQAFSRLKSRGSRSRRGSKVKLADTPIISQLRQRSAAELRAQCGHFRVLVIGRANAGKTTLLKRVCDSVVDPEIYDPHGKKMDPKVIEASESRGEHDIENQLIFKSNRQFIFHDSRGFESGSVEETERMKNFINERAKTRRLADQLHAIWYCLPTNTNRPLLRAEEDFFNTFARGTVPVIAVFTKFDGLIDETFAKLLSNGCTPEQAEKAALPQARETLSTDLKVPLERFKFHPSDYVQMDDMRDVKSDCSELIAKTANALNDNTLQMLLVSVQQNNVNLCIEFAVGACMDLKTIDDIVFLTLSYFPHIWNQIFSEEEYDQPDDRLEENYATRDVDARHRAHRTVADARAANDAVSAPSCPTAPAGCLTLPCRTIPAAPRECPVLPRRSRHLTPPHHAVPSPQDHDFAAIVRHCRSALEKKYPKTNRFINNLRNRAKVVSLICICMEQTFNEAHAARHQFPSAFSKALDAYYGSALQTTVDGEIATLPWTSLKKIKNTVVWKKSHLYRRMIEIVTMHHLRINPPAA